MTPCKEDVYGEHDERTARECVETLLRKTRIWYPSTDSTHEVVSFIEPEIARLREVFDAARV